MNAAKSQLDMIKEKSNNKEMYAKQLMHQVRNTIQNNLIELDATKQQRDDLITQLNEIKKGRLFLNVYGISY